MRAALILALALLSPAALARAPSAPPNPFIHKGTCPFECCTYRDWTTRERVTLVDRPLGKVTVAQVPRGIAVHGLTGEVHAPPMRFVAKSDDSETGIHKGDVFYALHSVGEGFMSVWYRGKVVDMDMSDYDIPYAKQKWDWWVKIRTPQGKIGWVLDTGLFANQDSCG